MELNLKNNNYFRDLKQLAGVDLSAAHIKQHTVTSDLTAQLISIPVQGPGTHSALKPNDTVNLDNGTITGRKHWVSNIPNCEWAVFNVQEKDNRAVVFVDIKDATVEMIPTLGMEDTLTGHLDFDHAPVIRVCDNRDPIYFPIMQQHSMAFITNHYGLAESLFADIDQYTAQANINCHYEKQKIKLQLSIMKLLWEPAIMEMASAASGDYYWHQSNTLYAFVKECLLNVVHLTTEVTGSGLYELGQVHHQRYRDALIYSSHMRNLYFCLQENLA